MNQFKTEILEVHLGSIESESPQEIAVTLKFEKHSTRAVVGKLQQVDFVKKVIGTQPCPFFHVLSMSAFVTMTVE